ncbi:unnamed protein product [Didymodactylos carnosus]|uniref:Uncharacterized protein n=2 Tax=Didymodactylos carnosus TaxID=1234261 RepID=A0A814C9U8_9BILA|nr:unnamed protein product [Didymodactylos carnosus]CAF3715479.1 unnamed protein product [Didymodactylos carnosus]
MFIERFDHSVTLSGMLEMSTVFLPINQNWNRFIREVDVTFENIESDMQHILMQIANETYIIRPSQVQVSALQKTDRIGSELKAMVRAPSGYCFAADVQYAGMHDLLIVVTIACSIVHQLFAVRFNSIWLDESSRKEKDGTDLHSKVANLVGISRDQAKARLENKGY